MDFLKHTIYVIISSVLLLLSLYVLNIYSEHLLALMHFLTLRSSFQPG